MQKRMLIVLGLVMVLALFVINLKHITPAHAAPVSPDKAKVAKFWIGKQYYEVDGKRYDMDVAPYIKNGRTMMPARYLAYSLGIPESNVKWNQPSQSVTIIRDTEVVSMQVGDSVFGVGGRMTIGKFDVAPEIIPPGRTMIPYRAVAQTLGALVFWDGSEQAVIVETWKETPPPVPQTVKKVTVYKDKTEADVVKLDGSTVKAKSDRPVMVTDPQDNGFTLDIVEWFKLWGVPESAILSDPVRGGVAVRAASGDYPALSSGYIYFYKGDKYAWNNFFEKSKVYSGTTSNIVLNNRLCAGDSAMYSVLWTFGKLGSFKSTDSYVTTELK